MLLKYKIGTFIKINVYNLECEYDKRYLGLDIILIYFLKYKIIPNCNYLKVMFSNSLICMYFQK